MHLQARMENGAACMLVLLAAIPEGGKELVGLHVDGQAVHVFVSDGSSSLSRADFDVG